MANAECWRKACHERDTVCLTIGGDYGTVSARCCLAHLPGSIPELSEGFHPPKLTEILTETYRIRIVRTLDGSQELTVEPTDAREALPVLEELLRSRSGWLVPLAVADVRELLDIPPDLALERPPRADVEPQESGQDSGLDERPDSVRAHP